MEESRRESNRVFFDGEKWKASLIVPRDTLESAPPSFIKPWDLSAGGLSFVTDVAFKLDMTLDVLLTHPQIEETLSIIGKIVRIDQIRELDNPVISYKIALRFDNIDTKSYELIRGLTG